MAKTKLKSVFTREDIYTVLQLLKALADGIDTNEELTDADIEKLNTSVDKLNSAITISEDTTTTIANGIAIKPSGDVNIGKNLEVKGKFTVNTEAKIYDKITDTTNNKMFVSGDVNVGNTIPNVTKTYGKWSLSGNSLTVVLAFETNDQSTTISAGQSFTQVIKFPTYISNRIVPIVDIAVAYGTGTACSKTGSIWTATRTNIPIIFAKVSDGFNILVGSGITSIPANTSVRVQFSLTI